MLLSNPIRQFRLKNKLSFFTLIIIAIVTFWYAKNLKAWGENSIINHDVIYYYEYLPAALIYNDLSFSFIKDLPKEVFEKIWLLPSPKGVGVSKMTMGNSLCWLPFFSLAHLYAKFSQYPANGYSIPYIFAIFASALFFLVLGLQYIRRILLSYFPDLTVSITLFLIVFATNLHYYVLTEPGMSHVYSFAFFSMFFFYSIKWIETQSWKSTLLLGFTFGMIVLIRPTNAVIGIIPLLIYVTSIQSFKDRLNLFFSNSIKIFIAAICMGLVLLPQLLYWKIYTGNWFYYSYLDEHFFFSNSQIINGLFSFRKGWLIYTPIMAFSLLGLFFVKKYFKGATFAISTFVIVNWYVIFSWWCWWYGGSYSSRPLVDSYAIMAIPFAAFLQTIISLRKKWIPILFACLFAFFILQNQFQMKQYRMSILHFDSMTDIAYRKIFFKMKWPDNYSSLVKKPDYEKAIKGIEDY